MAGVADRGSRSVDHVYDALGHRYRLEVDDDALAAYLREAHADLLDADPVDEPHTYRITSPRPGVPGRVTLDGDEIGRALSHARLISVLQWHVNQRALRAGGGLVLLHAAAAARGTSAVLLPADMGSGKSTLVAALVRAGYAYLTDETVAIDPTDGTVTPYPKPITLDAGSWDLFPELEPPVELGEMRTPDPQWHVPPHAVGATRRPGDGATTTPRVVIAPRYTRGATAELERLRPAEAYLVLARASFTWRHHPARDSAALARIAKTVACYRLRHDDLDRAVAIVGSTFAEGAPDAA